tara:strand:+ start:757 stop:1221 length:465 start_codon:yes stop_codon:yes gene_type:complete
MLKITTTRFNNNTYKENIRYRENNNIPCIYGTSLKIKDSICYKDNLYVIEMNNQENLIMGIGLIKNQLIDDKNYKIYTDKVYNRYIYIGTKYLNRETLDNNELEILEKLELLLFKGARHSKRAQGITALPEWIEKNELNFTNFINNLFIKYTII